MNGDIEPNFTIKPIVKKKFLSPSAGIFVWKWGELSKDKCIFEGEEEEEKEGI